MTRTSVTIFLDKDVKKELEKRAKKEFLSLEELINDIVRRSVISYKGNASTTDNVDDKFLTFFSRKSAKKK